MLQDDHRKLIKKAREEYKTILTANSIHTLYHFTDRANLKSIKKYGALFDEISTGISETLTLLQNRGSVYLAFEEHNGRKLVDLFFPDKELNFFHLFYFEVDNFSLAALQNKELKGWLYPYLRLDNLKEIDKEFDDNAKPKWKVPIGQK